MLINQKIKISFTQSGEDVRYESGGVVLANNTEEDETTSKKSDENVVKNTCFNCSGDHQVNGVNFTDENL